MSIRDGRGGAAGHLSRDAMARLASGTMGTDELLLVVAPHLVDRCDRCREVYEDLALLGRRFGHWNWSLAVVEWDEAGELWQRLSRYREEEQLCLVAEDETFQTWGLCRLLQRLSVGEEWGDAAGEDQVAAAGMGAAPGEGRGEAAAAARSTGAWVEAQPPGAGQPPGQPSGQPSGQPARHLANLAVAIAGRLADAYDPVWVRGLRATCLAALGNARRAAGELGAAADAFAAARALLRDGVGSAAFEAEVLALAALLARDERRLEAAIDDCRQARAICTGADPDTRDARLAARTLVQEAWCHHHLGRPARALERLEEALELLDAAAAPPPPAAEALPPLETAEDGPGLAVLARHGQLWAALALGRMDLAEPLLDRLRQQGWPAAGAVQSRGAPGAAALLPRARGWRALHLRLERAAARIAAARGRHEEACRLLRSAADRLLGMGEGVEAALALFDLAEVLLAAGREPELAMLGDDLQRLLLTSEPLTVDQRQGLVLFALACTPRRSAGSRQPADAKGGHGAQGEPGEQGAAAAVLAPDAAHGEPPGPWGDGLAGAEPGEPPRAGVRVAVLRRLAAVVEGDRRPSLAWWSGCAALAPGREETAAAGEERAPESRSPEMADAPEGGERDEP